LLLLKHNFINLLLVRDWSLGVNKLVRLAIFTKLFFFVTYVLAKEVKVFVPASLSSLL
jgi:hypothetical protein